MSILTSVSFLTNRIIHPLLHKNNITNVVQKRVSLNKNIDVKKNMNMNKNKNINKNNITNRDIDIYSLQDTTQEPIHNLFPKGK